MSCVVASMERTEHLLKLIGNETRRRILTLLSEKPHYISQISKKLDVTQPAILKHLVLLEKAGVIESFLKESPLGAPRKYYKICDSINIEVAIHPGDFKVTKRPLAIECPTYIHLEEEMRRLTEEINKARDITEKAAKAEELKDKADMLLSCRECDRETWSCKNCHRIASLKKGASEVIMQVAKGEILSGLKTLSSLINQLTS